MTIERIDLGIEYLGGIAKPSSDDVGKYAVVRLDSLGRPNLSYEDTADVAANDAFATSLAAHLRGAGLTVDASGNLRPRPRPRYAQLVDHFFGGVASSGSVGSLGWNLNGSGTPVVARGNITASLLSDRYQLTTSGSTNDRACLTLGSSETLKVAVASQCELLQFAIRPSSLANVRFFVGLQGDFSLEPTASTTSLGLLFDSGLDAAKFYTLARASGSGAPTISAVSASTSAGVLVSIHQPTTGMFVFYVGNTALGSISSGVPTAAANLGFRIETLTAAAKTLNISHFNGIFNLADANDDDTFLEA